MRAKHTKIERVEGKKCYIFKKTALSLTLASNVASGSELNYPAYSSVTE